MIDYSTISFTLGVFPLVSAVNSTTPSSKDGTPFIKLLIDDLWGARQALMDAAGLTPSGSTELAGASQALQAMQKVVGHPGEVIAWMGASADPSVVGIRLLPLNGQGVLRSAYPDLDDAVYVGDPDNPTAPAFYHADDAAGTTRNTTGIYLILPDLRGYILRGLDIGAIVDPDGASRELADAQDYAVKSHKHYLNDFSTPYNGFTLEAQTISAGVVDVVKETGGTGTVIADSENFAAVNSGTAETSEDENRMVNVSTRWVIRY
jgi:hypothetical protein